MKKQKHSVEQVATYGDCKQSTSYAISNPEEYFFGSVTPKISPVYAYWLWYDQLGQQQKYFHLKKRTRFRLRFEQTTVFILMNYMTSPS